MAKISLKLNGINKYYSTYKALDNFSLEVYEGEFFTLLGPSGCGKTTALRVIAGLETPDDGEIFLGDKPIVSTSKGLFIPSERRDMGMVFQSYAIWPHMTVFKNVAYPLIIRKFKKDVIRDRVDKALALVGLSSFSDRPSTNLSGGQQQRVALARALVYEPKILLLDEPFSNLDANLREEMRIETKLLQKKTGLTVIFVTHDQEEALGLSDRMCIISKGQIEQIGTPQELYENPSTPIVRNFLGKNTLFEGEIIAVLPNGNVEVKLKKIDDGHLLITNPKSKKSFSPGQSIQVSIRSEYIELLADDDVSKNAPNKLKGFIKTAEYQGKSHKLLVHIYGDKDVTIQTQRKTDFYEGKEVYMSVLEKGIELWEN